MRKTLALLIAAIMLFTIVPVAMGGFEDSPRPSHWVYDQFMLVYNSGLLKGYPDGTFKGERFATRYEMVELTARVLRLFEARIAGVDVDPTKAAVGLSADQVKAIIAEELAARDSEHSVEEVYQAVQALEAEFREDLEALNVRVSTLEAKVDGMNEKVETAAKDAKSAKTFGIIGIILGLAGIALGVGQ